ncbi:flagella biosynthesis chaperone for FliD, FliT [Shewanella aestuarii]|uniref:Flagella biosynthesis chaperone for FliD, FliT n=1 Tax=Shewanella aestuarii TaxID=1028752 RepID=A0A6G9QJD7_9GAMM|nr:flagella biosynthesis chaperone for FliD, FliT [Shewanella aestuarii]QIR13981.1 flagella biosynthesis chaperone for FliD, FliT [Shewanella aestuarii]
MSELDSINQLIINLFSEIESIPAENEKSDNLVSNLHELFQKRQLFIEKIINNELSVDEKALREQIDLTNQFSNRAQAISQNRKDLLSIGKSNKRKIQVYKTIDSDR